MKSFFVKFLFKSGARSSVAAMLTALLLAGAAFSAQALDKININRADAMALTTLNGIGPAKAEAIVEYRKANGPFRSVDDLTAVKGLGVSILERNRDRLTIGEESASTSTPVP
ncbi:MAG: ComEA family DNA-binding protein [Chromatiales bacterium]|jgi:competence protein ComEA|nr:ComEA family DNA-binding protein [Chromatiales bacterium]